jgi:hypothetical protein
LLNPAPGFVPNPLKQFSLILLSPSRTSGKPRAPICVTGASALPADGSLTIGAGATVVLSSGFGAAASAGGAVGGLDAPASAAEEAPAQMPSPAPLAPATRAMEPVSEAPIGPPTTIPATSVTTSSPGLPKGLVAVAGLVDRTLGNVRFQPVNAVRRPLDLAWVGFAEQLLPSRQPARKAAVALQTIDYLFATFQR